MPFHTEQYSSWFKRRPFAPPYGTLAQWSVPPAHNRSYAGSNPARSTKRAAASGDFSPSVTSGSKKAQSGKPDTHHPAGKTVLQHRTPVISERLSKSAGFCDKQSLQLRWDDFFFGVSPFTAFHIPGKVPGTYRHRLHGLPRIPLPGHTRKIEFVTIMSTYKFSLCRLELVVCRDFIFDSIQGEFILLYTKQEIQSFSDEFIYSRMKELLSSPLCRDIPESEQVDCLFCLERYDCANSIPPEFFQLNDEFQRKRYINRRRAAT